FNVLKKRYQPLDSYQRKGKIYSLIDYVILGAAMIFEKYHSSPIWPLTIHGKTEFVAVGLSTVSFCVLLLAFERTSSSNCYKLVPKHKKHIAGIEFFFFFLPGFLILIFTADPLTRSISRKLPLEQIAYHLERLYFLHFFMMFYVLLRCVLAFNYYQAFYYEDKKCKMFYVMVCFFVGRGIIHILLGVLSLVVSFIYHF
ncbi:MAG: hypothetical protein ABS908_09965, partial [Enterococcus casseliflavus]